MHDDTNFLLRHLPADGSAMPNHVSREDAKTRSGEEVSGSPDHNTAGGAAGFPSSHPSESPINLRAFAPSRETSSSREAPCWQEWEVPFDTDPDWACAITDADQRRWLLPGTDTNLIQPIKGGKGHSAISLKQAEAYRAAIPNHVSREDAKTRSGEEVSGFPDYDATGSAAGFPSSHASGSPINLRAFA